MLVVTANWAIPDGSVSAPPPRLLFERLFAEMVRAAVRAGFRSDGRYQPIERVVLVLAGDTFDGLVSARWLGAVRPWERRREAAARQADVLRAAWRHGRRPLAAVVRLARRGIAVPSAGVHGRPVLAAPVPVPVRVAMLAGDRDAAVERLALDLPSERIGLGVGTAWNGDAVRVIHGSPSDPLATPDTGPTLLESLAVDLLARFGAALVARPGFGDRSRRLVRSLAAGQPLDMPLRLRNLLPTAIDDAAEATWAVDIWRRSVDRWAREARRWGCAADNHGVVDAIAWWMQAVEPGGRPRPAVRQVIEALATPLPVGDGGGQALTVVGHLGPRVGGRPGIVCLGPPAVQPAATLRPIVPGGVSCIQAGPSLGLASLPALVVFEAGEGAGRRCEWLSAPDAGAAEHVPPGVVPILDAA